MRDWKNRYRLPVTCFRENASAPPETRNRFGYARHDKFKISRVAGCGFKKTLAISHLPLASHGYTRYAEFISVPIF